jgi:hypothetical protein
MNQRYGLPPAASIDAKVSDIGRYHWKPWVQFTEANQTQLGEVGAPVCIASRQLRQSRQVFSQSERGPNKPVANKSQYQGTVAKVKSSFSQHCLACQ